MKNVIDTNKQRESRSRNLAFFKQVNLFKLIILKNLYWILLGICIVILLVLSNKYKTYESKKVTEMKASKTVKNTNTITTQDKNNYEYKTEKTDNQKNWKSYLENNCGGNTIKKIETHPSKEDIEQIYWSPLNNYYLKTFTHRELPVKYWALYDSQNSLISCFNPNTENNTSSFNYVSSIYHSYWKDNGSIIFYVNKYPDSEKRVYTYNTANNELKDITDSYDYDSYDYDNKGGLLKVKHDIPDTEKLTYISLDGTEIHIGILRGHVLGLSPSGKYILAQIPIKENESNTRRGNITYQVVIFPVIENGIDKRIDVGNVSYVIGGYEGMSEPIFAKWSEDESVITYKTYLSDENTYYNPFK